MPGTGQSKMAERVRAISALLAILAAIALIVVWFLSWTLLSHSDKYGRVNIPGETVLHLPAGEVQVSFRTLLATNGGNGALNLPPLSLGIHPAGGAGEDPAVKEDIGATKSVNGDAHARVWTVQVGSEGDYRVVADGQVGGYINPQLTFGSDTSVSGILIALGIATGALLALAIGAHLVVRRGRREAGGLALE